MDGTRLLILALTVTVSYADGSIITCATGCTCRSINSKLSVVCTGEQVVNVSHINRNVWSLAFINTKLKTVQFEEVFPALERLVLRQSPIVLINMTSIFGNCPKLTSLTISKCPLQNLTIDGNSNHGLQQIRIDNTNLSSITFSSIPQKLQELRLMNNRINCFDFLTQTFPSLETLVLTATLMTELNMSHISTYFPALKSLYVNQNLLRMVTIGSHSKLRILNLHSNQIRTLNVTDSLLPSLDTLVLNYNNISDLPFRMKAENLRYIEIGYNAFTVLANFHEQFPRLQYLSARANNIVSIELFHENLQTLHLNDNNLQQIRNGSIRAPNLKILSLMGNKISRGTFSKDMPKLRNLYLKGNEISDLQNLSFNSVSLRYLDLSENKLKELTNLSGAPNLEILILESNAINTINTTHLQETKVENLKLRSNFITEISIVNGVNNLKYLNLEDNKLQNIALWRAPSLRYLYLKRNHINNLSNVISNESLRLIDLSENQVTHLHGQANIKTEFLYLSRNRITSINIRDGFQGLRRLNLDRNQISSKPMLYITLPNVEWVQLQNNYIEEFTSATMSMPELTYLNLQNNKLVALDMRTGFPLLKSLYLNDNFIGCIGPDEMYLPSLRTLSASNNLIRKIDLTAFPSLYVLQLPNNKLSAIYFNNTRQSPIILLEIRNTSLTCSCGLHVLPIDAMALRLPSIGTCKNETSKLEVNLKTFFEAELNCTHVNKNRDVSPTASFCGERKEFMSKEYENSMVTTLILGTIPATTAVLMIVLIVMVMKRWKHSRIIAVSDRQTVTK